MLNAFRCSERVRTPLMSLLARAATIREKSAGTGISPAVSQRRIQLANEQSMRSQLSATRRTALHMIFEEQRDDLLPIRHRRTRRSDLFRRSFPDAVVIAH